MKICAIRGEGIQSLREAFSVDLESEPLAQGVFVISGPTGSGKSSLLDAMCLALFDTTPRLSSSKRSTDGSDKNALTSADPRNLLSRGAPRAIAEVDFIGRDGRKYRARWEVKRARGQADAKLQKQTLTLTLVENGEGIGGTKTETLHAIEERLGLTFDQFRRAVLLAQGEFAAFLLASDRVRAEILERVTGTEIYGWISMVVFQKASDAKKQLDGAERVLSLAQALAPNERRKLGGQLDARKKERNAKEGELHKLEAQKRYHEAFLALQKLAQAAQDELTQAQRTVDELKESSALFVRFEQVAPYLRTARELRQVRLEQHNLDEECARASAEIAQHLAHATDCDDSARMLERTATALADEVLAQEAFARAQESEIASKRALANRNQELRAWLDREHALANPRESARVDWRVDWRVEALSLLDAQRHLVDVTLEVAPAFVISASSLIVLDAFQAPEFAALQQPSPSRAAIHQAMCAVDERLRALLASQATTNPHELHRAIEALIATDTTTAAQVEELVREHHQVTNALAAQKVTLEKSRRDHNQLTLEQQQASARAAALQATLTQLRERLTVVQQRVRDAESIETTLRLEHDVTESELAALQRMDDVALSTWRRKVQHQENEVQKWNTIADERRMRLDAHRSAAPSGPVLRDVVDTLITHARDARDRLSVEVEKLANEQLSDERVRREKSIAEKIRKTAEVEWQRWQRLAQVIGSADGKKLRVYAQNVTLDVLLRHANVELRSIAPRYQLRRSNAELGLVLVDLEMGGEIRSAQSLSGGETFLVSLALALGLSSLAENDLSIRTLFVDEGFGSLDPDALDMALSALESLALRGRQVGVVTHIPQVSERFSSQVEVRRLGSGESEVYVHAR